MFNEPVNTRENVRSIFGETPIGEALVKKIPEWAFASSRPPALTDIAFASPAKLVAELVVTEVNRPVNALMMLDLLWQLTDIWRDNTTTDVQKLVSTGGITAMLVDAASLPDSDGLSREPFGRPETARLCHGLLHLPACHAPHAR